MRTLQEVYGMTTLQNFLIALLAIILALHMLQHRGVLPMPSPWVEKPPPAEGR